MCAHLSKELRNQYNRRSIGVRKGDEVKIMRGKFKGKTATIEEINNKKGNIFLSGIKLKKTVGTEKQVPIKSINVVVINMNLNDKKRRDILLRKVKEVKIPIKKTEQIKPKIEKNEIKEPKVQKSPSK